MRRVCQVKKNGKHLVVAVSIEGDAITAQAHRLNNPKVPMHQLMMANHEEVLAAVERYLPRAFWSNSWWHASPSCKKGSCANYGQSPAEVKNWFKTANWTVALLKKTPFYPEMEPLLRILPRNRGIPVF